MRTISLAVLCLLAVCSLLQAEEVDRPDQPGWVPEFVSCPTTVVVDYHDSVSFAFQAINPHSAKPVHPIKYSLVDGPGTVDSVTGVWAYKPDRDPFYKNTAAVEVKATFASTNLGRDATCRFLVKVKVPNTRPVIVNTGVVCADTIYSYLVVQMQRNYCDAVYYDFDACDPNGQPYVFELVSGPGAIDTLTGVWSLPGTLTYGPSDIVKVWVRARGQQVSDSVPLILQTTHERFSIQGCPRDTIRLVSGQLGSVLFSTDSYCGHLDWSVVDDSDPITSASISQGLVTFRASSAGVFTATVVASDGFYADSCIVTFSVRAESDFGLTIERTSKTLQGQYEYVDIDLARASSYSGIGGFDLLIAYDASAISLSEVTKGEFLRQCKWEYFAYRFGNDGGCGAACPSGVIRVLGIAETNDGDNHPSCYTPPALPMTLFTLTFLVSNDRTLECQFVPIRFFWTDCEDNAMSSPTGDTRLFVDRVFDYVMGGDSIPLEPPVTFPSYSGVPEGECDLPSPSKPVSIPLIDFYDGGINIVCADSIDARGDINLNGLQFEIADLILFSRYFQYGTAVFTINPAGQVAATDINKDSIPLTLEDYVCMYRAIMGKDPKGYACSPPSVNQAIFTIVNNTVFVATPDTIGALFLTFQGNVRPSLLTDKFTMDYNFDGTSTRVLLGPSVQIPPDSDAYLLAGQVLGLSASTQIIEAQAVTYRGGRISTHLDAATSAGEDLAGSVPDRFALHQNYPNPFNAGTIISFDLPKSSQVHLNILNTLGQVVFEHTATYAAGSHSFLWNGQTSQGTPAGSGIYFIRIDTEEFSGTRKMLMLK